MCPESMSSFVPAPKKEKKPRVPKVVKKKGKGGKRKAKSANTESEPDLATSETVVRKGKREQEEFIEKRG